MPLDIERLPQANDDLIELYWYIVDRSPAGASSTMRQIDDAVRILAENPEAGRLRSELRDNLRSFPAGNYNLFYSVGTVLTVVRVLSAARDVTAEFFAD